MSNFNKYQKYQKSISDELISIKDRVRHFIGNNHWGEDGRYKENILSHVLRKHLPKSVSVGTGFIVNNNDDITKQIDIIIYRNDIPLLFKQDDFIIAPAECVLGIIEVKSRATTSIFREVIQTAKRNGDIIGRSVFNGLFAFVNGQINLQNQRLINAFRDAAGSLNHACIGKNKFIKYWDQGMLGSNPHPNPYYAVYEIRDLAFGYFISNLLEHIYKSMSGEALPTTLENMFYPIPKEAHRSMAIQIE
jgi:hypothetical protein